MFDYFFILCPLCNRIYFKAFDYQNLQIASIVAYLTVRTIVLIVMSLM